MSEQIFLGGACGQTTWRRDIAIPALETAGVSYHNPQLGPGEWTEAHQAAEMKAKEEAAVVLFVITGDTRGVASVGEAAYYLGMGRALALSVEDVPPGGLIDGKAVTPAERDDLNRGRVFLRSMGAEQGVPVFTNVAEAVQYATELAKVHSMTVGRLRSILDEIRFGNRRFSIEISRGGYLIHLHSEETDVDSGMQRAFDGRKWFVASTATTGEVVRTALKAALTWQEHEVRDQFTYRGERVFGPHFELE